MKVLTDLHMSSNQIYNSGFETVKSLPTSDLFKGRIVFYEVDNLYYQYNGTEWIALSGSGGGGTTINGVGEDVSGKSYTIDGTSYTAGTNAEIFNDYTNNKAIGDYSHAEGGGTTALANYSHAEGGGTTASGISAHAEGGGTTASGPQSHAEGASTTASGDQSHAEGVSTTASGQLSHTEGLGTIASSAIQHVQGKYNVEDSENKYAFIIGNGTSPSSKSNAFAVDWNGLLYKGNTTEGVDITKYVGKDVSGKSYIIGDTSYTAGTGAEIFNDYTNNKAVGQYSHAEGNGTTASGSYSHAEGTNTTASSICSHAEGQNTTASGEDSHAEGVSTTASGSQSHAEGYKTTAS